MVRRRRLDFEHIGPVAPERPRFESPGHRAGIDQLAPGAIDEKSVGPHPRDHRGIDQIAGFLGQEKVERHHIGRLEDLPGGVEPPHPMGFGEIPVPIRIVADNGHSECPGAHRHLLADPAQTENADRLAHQLVAGLPLPLAAARRGRRLREPLAQAEHQTEGVFGHGRMVDAGSEQHRNPLRRSMIHIDLVDPDPVLRDHPQTGQGFVDHGRRDRVVPAQKRIELPRQLQHALLGQRSALAVDVEPGRLQQLAVPSGRVLE